MRHLPPLMLSPVIPRARVGLKGRDAAATLEGAGIRVPPRANCLVHGGGLSRCLRLGSTEFLLEDDADTARLADLRQVASAATLRAYVAPRADFSALLSGPAVFDSLSPYCSFDFTALRAAPDTVVMTLLADISVVLALEPGEDSAPRLRLWADAGFAHYLTETLTGEHR